MLQRIFLTNFLHRENLQLSRNVKFNKIFNSYSEAIDFLKKKYREEDGKKVHSLILQVI